MSSYQQPGTVVTDLSFRVPLDHSDPRGEQIELFARQVVAVEHAGAELPWLLFLQGGPGFGAPRPAGRDSWLDRALRDYRVLLLDQRGTGRSSPANRKTLRELGSPQAQADYLAYFRADSIVADAEIIRSRVTGGRPWTVLGQSFGGFATVTYLSQAPAGIREAIITGGLPGLAATPDDVYRLTYPVVIEKNLAHYQRYPQDVAQVRRVASKLLGSRTTLPSGAALTVEAFQALGQMLGSATGSHTLHYLLENPFAGDELSDDFLYQVQAQLSFGSAPLYALLHEACYAQGAATRWAAHRIRAEFSEFDAIKSLETDDPVLFTGEMIYPWMFDNDPVLRPLAAAADLLAHRGSWPGMYDPGQLRRNEVPAAAAIYFDDMYVPRDLSVATARAIRGLRRWVTSEYEHDGLRVSSGVVLDHLLDLIRGEL